MLTIKQLWVKFFGSSLDSILSDITKKVQSLEAHAAVKLEHSEAASKAALDLIKQSEDHALEHIRASRVATQFRKLIA